MEGFPTWIVLICSVFSPASSSARASLVPPIRSACHARRCRGRAGTGGACGRAVAPSHYTPRLADPGRRSFYERCLRVVAEVEDTENLFRQTAAQPSGRLKIDVPGRIGRLIIAPALPEFLDRYPQIDIDLGVSDRAVNLIEDGVDCVLRVGPLNDSGLIARPIGKLALINVASPAYLKRYGAPDGPSDLGSHWAVNYASPPVAGSTTGNGSRMASYALCQCEAASPSTALKHISLVAWQDSA